MNVLDSYSYAWANTEADLVRWVKGYRADAFDYEQTKLFADIQATLADSLRDALPDDLTDFARERRVMASLEGFRRAVAVVGTVTPDTTMALAHVAWTREAAHTATLVSDTQYTVERAHKQQRIEGPWYWKARLDTRTCLICIVLHGSAHEASEPMTGAHPNCRCVPSATPLRQTGKEWLLERSPRTWRKMFGPGRTRLLVEEGADPEDLVDLDRGRLRPLREFGVRRAERRIPNEDVALREDLKMLKESLGTTDLRQKLRDTGHDMMNLAASAAGLQRSSERPAVEVRNLMGESGPDVDLDHIRDLVRDVADFLFEWMADNYPHMTSTWTGVIDLEAVQGNSLYGAKTYDCNITLTNILLRERKDWGQAHTIIHELLHSFSVSAPGSYTTGKYAEEVVVELAARRALMELLQTNGDLRTQFLKRPSEARLPTHYDREVDAFAGVADFLGQDPVEWAAQLFGMTLRERLRAIEDAIEAKGGGNTAEHLWLEQEVRAWVASGRQPLTFEAWKVQSERETYPTEAPEAVGPPAALGPTPLPRAFTNKVLAKIRDAVVPTVAERRKAERDYATKGARAVERNARGNEYDRHASQKRLLAEFSLDGGKTCPCVYCGVLLTWKDVTRERIHAGSAGGRYRHDNLLPACSFCNKSRGDRDIRAALQRRWGRRVRLR